MSNCTLPKCFPASLPEGLNIFEQFNQPTLNCPPGSVLSAGLCKNSSGQLTVPTLGTIPPMQNSSTPPRTLNDLTPSYSLICPSGSVLSAGLCRDNSGLLSMPIVGVSPPNQNSSTPPPPSNQNSSTPPPPSNQNSFLENNKIADLQDRLDKLTLSQNYGSGAPSASSTEKSDSSNNMLIYVVVGFLTLIILILIFLVKNQQK